MLKTLRIGLLLLTAFGSTLKLQSQICGATNSLSCTAGDFISGVSFKNSSGTTAAFTGLNCSNTGGSNVLLTKGAMMDLLPGEKFDITVDVCPTFAEWIGVWIDMNGDNTFTASECISGPSGPIGQIPSNSSKKTTLTVPCVSVFSGKVIMRVRCFYSSGWTTSQGCGTVSNYGNILDFEVNLKKVNPPSANFTVPTGPNYVKVPIVFNSNVQELNYTQSWTFPGGVPVVPTGPKGKASYNAAGTYDVMLKQSFCGISDSILKQVTIVKPTIAPVADFIATDNQVEVFYSTQLLDLSTNGAYKWSWVVTSPTGAVMTSNAQNPILTFDELGKWDVCLTSENDLGPSPQVCKSKYIDCTNPSEYFMGPNHLGTNQGGVIYDNGGKDLNYGNNRKVTIDYFKILPCGAKEIRLRLKQLRLTDVNDKIKIYDGNDESGKLLTPANGINGTNQADWRNVIIKATSGAMYITFESNSSGVDSGFIGVWDSELLPPSKPKSNWTTDYDPSANGMSVHFASNVTQAQGNVEYEWQIDGNPSVGAKNSLDYVFSTDGQYQVCLVAATCNGNDTFCKNITIVTPTKPGILDFTADKQRPRVGDVVTLSTNTDYASNFEWSIFPTTYSFINGTNSNSRNPQVVLTTGGSYTFTLIAWNSVGGRVATEKKLIKNKYVIAVSYCTPVTDLLSADVGINRVTLSQNTMDLFENESTSGDLAYSDFTDEIKQTLTFGTEYKLRVLRRTNVNTVNFKAWIDYNIDGDFDDAGENILSTGVTNGIDGLVSFTTPRLSESFEGETRMRVAVSYGSFNNSPCGVNIVGEFEDYGILLVNDKQGPKIDLIGDEIVYVEKKTTKTGCYAEVAGTSYKAADPTEGDLTADVQLTSDLDCSIPGTYYIDFTLADASGNQAPARRRTVIVVLDKTAPTLTLNGNNPMVIEQCDAYNEPGAVASDLVDGNLNTAIKIVGAVDGSKVGTYTVKYSVTDAQGNEATAVRTVEVKDTKKPGIYSRGSRIVDQQVVNLQIGSVFLDDVYAEDACNGLLNISKVAGFNGVVNTLQRATYEITYFAEDPSGNKADEDGFTILYRVDDYVVPQISLNTADTVVHDVNKPYSPQQVSVFDNYYALNQISVSKTGTVNPYKLGVYSELYTAIDGSGNVGVKTRYIKVVDREAPQIITSALTLCVGSSYWALNDVIVSDNYYGEDVLKPLIQVVNHNVNIWQRGLYFINYQVIDPSGNKSEIAMRPVMVNYAPDCEANTSNVDAVSKEEITLYPNPASTEMTVKLTSTLLVSEVKIFNQQGQLVKVQKTDNNSSSVIIDVRDLSAGTYTVQVTDSNGKSMHSALAIGH